MAEEMNRCRRMASLQARALADAGFAVLQIDLLGCGDSSGDFADATWSAWLDDVDLARQWLQSRSGGPLWLWGARAGCLLVAQSAARTPAEPVNLLLWQPVVSGRQHLQQFLRLQQVSEAVQGGGGGSGGRSGTQALLQRLENGQAVEVAGYEMHPALAKGLSVANLDQLGNPQQVVVLELALQAQVGPYVATPALLQQLQRWTDAKLPNTVIGVQGAPFWQVPEAPTCDALIQSTVAALAGAPRP
jgi:exosortase A-associated hydrolase 2